MTVLDIKKTIRELIDEREFESELRPYLGYSAAGQSCPRKIWYDFRWVYPKVIPARVQRIFDTGHIFEEFIDNALKQAGMHIFSDQKEMTGQHGHAKGHIDGVILHVPGFHGKLLLEKKTMNDRRFKKWQKEGVKKSDPTYYGQAVAYMAKEKLQATLFVAYNKNDSSIDTEIIMPDPEYFEFLESRLFDVLVTELPPDKIGNKTWFECRTCSAKEVCQDDKPVVRSCRTCALGTIEEGGKWSCDGKKMLSVEEQRIGCNSWQLMDGLKPIDIQILES